MARQVQINTSVDSNKAVSSINTLKKAFQELNKAIEKHGKDGVLDLKVNLSGVDANLLKNISSSFAKLGKGMELFNKNIDGVTKSGKLLNITTNNITNDIQNTTNNIKNNSSVVQKTTNTYKNHTSVVNKTSLSYKEYNKTLIGTSKAQKDFERDTLATLAVFSTIKTHVGNTIAEYNKLTDATFAVGIAGQMNLKQISALNDSFLSLSTTVPRSAESLARAVDGLIRTGRSYEDARDIIQEVAKLSVGSADDLKSTAEIVTKIMVSLGVSGSRTSETLTTLHSVAIQTASDMKYLAGAFKSVAGSASIFVNSAGLSNEKLEDYKQTVLKTNMAIIGFFANMGLSASEAGTKTKQLMIKLLSMEKVAKNMFNETMKANNVMNSDGGIFTYDNLRELASKDMPMAIQKLSELRYQGVLTRDVLSKMFTARHFGDITAVLDKIGGDIDKFVERTTQGVDYTQDALKNMFNINEQMKLLSNNMMNTTKGWFGQLNKTTTGMLMNVNSLLSGWEANTKEMETSNNAAHQLLNTLTLISGSALTTVTTLSGITVANNLMKNMFVDVGRILKSYGGLATVAVAMFSKLMQYTYDMRAGFVDIAMGLQSIPKALKESVDASDSLESSIAQTKSLLEEGNRNAFVDSLSIANDLVDSLLSKSKNLKDYLDVAQDWKIQDFKPLNTEIGETTDKLKEQIEKRKEAMEGYRLEIEKIKNSYLKVSSFDKPLYRDKGKFDRARYETIVKDTYIEEVLKGKLPLEEIRKLINDKLKQEGLAASDLKTDIIVNELNISGLKTYGKQIADTTEKIKSLNIALQTRQQIGEEQAKQNIDAQRKLKSLYAQESYVELMRTGSTSFGGNTYSGVQGLYNILSSSLSEEVDEQIEQAKAVQKEQEKILEDIKLKYDKMGLEVPEEILAQRDKAQELLKMAQSDEEALKKQQVELAEKLAAIYVNIIPEAIKQLKLDPENAKDIAEFLRIAISSGLTVDNSDKSKGEKLYLEKKERNILANERARLEKKSSDTKYQLKHISYAKEDLQLQLELAKIGKTKEEQAFLEYKYKLETLKVNESLAKIEEKQVRKMTKEYKLETAIGATYMKKALESKNARQVEGLLQSFETKYSGIMTGESGRAIKSDYDAIVKLLKAMRQVEEASNKFSIEIQKGLASIENYDISTIYESLSGKGANFREKYIRSLLNEFNSQKSKIAKDFALGEDFNLQKELENSASKIDLLKAIGQDPSKLHQYKEEFIKTFGEDLYKGSIASNEELALLFTKEEQLMTSLVALEKMRTAYNDKNLDSVLKQYEALSSVAGLFSKMGDVFGVELFGHLSDVTSTFKDYHSFLANPDNDFDVSKIFNPEAFKTELEKGVESIDWSKFSENLGKAFESMTKGLSQGSAVGNLVGGLIGGGQSSQMAGGLAGLVTGAMKIDGFAGLGIQVGASLLGGLFDKGNKEQEEADKKTKEANKIYNKNTEALQKLSQNMANLNGGVDGLNNSLISTFSKLPTVGNLDRVTDAMSQLYKTMDKTRIFNEVAYQVTKTKKGKKGFLGIGATAGSSWTETIKLSVQDMLNRYGFKGTIDDMSTQEIRDFSKWLKDYDLGDSDNFSVLAEALENYAEALDKFDKNIDNFFRDSTMEAFEGISSLQQEELRQQIEDFYKNLGLQIDEETSKEIDKLAEQMSVMVTIMQDVRGNFVNSWRDSGVDAGRAFITSMTPYIDAMLSNISQIFYDVYFSDVNKQLEDEFKALSEKLVELKRKGADLDWSNVANELGGSFEKVIAVINSTKKETESFNTILFQLQKQAMDSGLSLSEIFDLGLVTGTQKSVIETFKESLTSGEADSAFKAIGNMVGDKVGQAMVNKMIDNLMGDKIFEMSAQLDKVLSGDLNFDSLAGLANDAMGVGLMLERERLRLSAITDMFNWDRDITYENQNSNIQYESGTSQSIVNNYYLTTSIEAGNVIESDSLERLADALTDIMKEKFKVDKGIDLDKLR